MSLRLVTVTLDPETGAFPGAPLTGLEGEVVSVVEHFFFHEDRPHLLLVVHLREPSASRARPPQAASRRQEGPSDPRHSLSPDERELYERLRAWRLSRSETDKQVPFAILTNQQAAEIARRRPPSLAALKEIHGIGEMKAQRYGKEILEMVAHRAS